MMKSVEKINNFCLSSLQPFLKITCGLEDSENNGKYLLIPKGDYSYVRTLHGVNGKTVDSVILKNIEEFALSFNISYANLDNKKRNITIADVSIQLFTSQCLFARAEWMNYLCHHDANKKHPQPHWHFIPYSIFSSPSLKTSRNFEETMNANKEEVDNFQDFLNNSNVSISPKIENIHYAMSMQWNNSKESTIHELTEENLRQWLPLCLYTIHQQLNGIKRKKAYT